MEESNVPPIDPDFEPQSRPRSCTWPLPRPDISIVKAEGADGNESTAGTPPADEDKPETQQITPEYEKAAAAEGGLGPSVGGAAATPRKGSSRRNAWGNQSYADLISQAIENSPEKRLTLAQIYEWMVKTVPYFRDKGDSNSSAGWKNSIRHNLSLHNKFLRVHNESTGKSSWWMLNPEGGKTGKAPRRRAASMDNSSKLLKSRMRAKQTKKQAVAAGLSSSGAALPSSRGSLDDADMWTTFRPRTSSNASTLSGRLSPIAPGQEDDDNLPDESLLGRYSTPTLTETLMEELDLIDGLTLMTAQGGASPSTASTSATVSQCGPSSAHYTGHVPSSLEALLTSDSPPPSEVLLTQVDPLMQSPGGVGLMSLGSSLVGVRSKASVGPLLMGKVWSPTLLPPCELASPGQGGGPLVNPNAGLQGMGQFGAPSCFQTAPDRLPTDLDIDMFTENLDCDVDYIINTDLMDGIDFNFDPILPDAQGYTGPATAQGSSHNWVPS
uniref:Forkhead box O4 n=1 Tax=Neogobius melanostomus TaxID=47308 RepID=A0A8C6UBJ5_9GOBI